MGLKVAIPAFPGVRKTTWNGSPPASAFGFAFLVELNISSAGPMTAVGTDGEGFGPLGGLGGAAVE